MNRVSACNTNPRVVSAPDPVSGQAASAAELIDYGVTKRRQAGSNPFGYPIRVAYCTYDLPRDLATAHTRLKTLGVRGVLDFSGPTDALDRFKRDAEQAVKDRTDHLYHIHAWSREDTGAGGFWLRAHLRLGTTPVGHVPQDRPSNARTYLTDGRSNVGYPRYWIA